MRQILAGSVATLYNVDLAALAPLAAQFGPTVNELKPPLLSLPENAHEALLKGARSESVAV